MLCSQGVERLATLRLANARPRPRRRWYATPQMNARRLRLTFALLILVMSARTVAAATITVNLDAGAAGTSFMFKDFFFTNLAGTEFDGQTVSVDVMFSGFLVTPLLTVDLMLNQASGLGVSPTTGFTVSGYLLDDAGLAASATTAMPMTVQMPGQLHPGWPYTLPDGQHYLPPTTGYELGLQGAAAMVLIDPLVFSGIHFDITMPNSADSLIGSRLSLASFGSGQFFRQNSDWPISVSPDPIPTYTVPDSSTTRVLLLFSVLAIIVTRTKIFD